MNDSLAPTKESGTRPVSDEEGVRPVLETEAPSLWQARAQPAPGLKGPWGLGPNEAVEAVLT